MKLQNSLTNSRTPRTDDATANVATFHQIPNISTLPNPDACARMSVSKRSSLQNATEHVDEAERSPASYAGRFGKRSPRQHGQNASITQLRPCLPPSADQAGLASASAITLDSNKTEEDAAHIENGSHPLRAVNITNDYLIDTTATTQPRNIKKKPEETAITKVMSISPPPPPPPPPAPEDLATAILGIRSSDRGVLDASRHMSPKVSPPYEQVSNAQTSVALGDRPTPPPPPPPPPPAPNDLATAILGLRTSDLVGSTADASRHLSSKESEHRTSGTNFLPPSQQVTQQSRLVALIQETMRDQETLMRKRLAAVSRRNGLRSQLALYHEEQQRFKNLFNEALPVTKQASVSPDAQQRLRQSLQKSEKLLQTIENLQEIEIDEEESLLDMERRCITHETDVSRLLRDYVPQPVKRVEADTFEMASDSFPSSSSQTSSKMSTASGSTATIVGRYNRTVGHVNLLRDRMFNLTSELHLQAYRRTVNIESGRTVKQSEQDFYATFQKRRQDIVREYQATRKEMDETYQTCLSEGLDVQPPGLSADVDQIFSEVDDHVSLQLGKEHQFDFPRSGNNIVRWAEEVQRLSQSGSSRIVDLSGIDEDNEEEPPSPLYQYAQSNVSTVSGLAIVSTTAARSERRPASFIGEIPTARRRYSAPMLYVKGKHDKDTPALDFQDTRARRTNRKRKEQRLGHQRAKSHN